MKFEIASFIIFSPIYSLQIYKNTIFPIEQQIFTHA